MTALEQLMALAHASLDRVLDRSGNILYSGVETLSPGPVYLLGLNPGGDPKRLSWQTLRTVLKELPSKTKNEYLDVSWQGRPPGQSVLQRRVVHLATMLGVDPRSMCATNLIFVRSREARSCGYPALAEVCWPVHEAILKTVRPRLTVCFGNSSESPYAFLRSILPVEGETAFPSGHGTWSCRAFRSNRMWVVGVPHLSRYAVDKHPKVGERMRAFLESPAA
jgi:hypothetical protein